MEHISIKLDSPIVRKIEKCMKEFNYSTKTDFIRESVRDKINLLLEEKEKRKAWKALANAKGIFRGEGSAKTDTEWLTWKKKHGKKLAHELAQKHNLEI